MEPPGGPFAPERRAGGQSGRETALHVDRAAAPDHAVGDFGGKRIEAPARRVARRHDIRMAGEHQAGRPPADPGVEIVDVGRVRAR